MRRIDGQVFINAVRAGALAVVREQEELNRINVFPVRDADTGANLAATLKAAAARLGSAAAPLGVGDAARVAADGALDGARGNSGAIFAQFLHGLAGGIGRREHVSPDEFADAARSGADSAYGALADPREGTILSVLRAWAHELGQRRRSDEDFVEMMRSGLAAAREALADTPRQLEVLARSHVVDAGGQGFVYFLEGLSEALRGGGDGEWTAVEASVAHEPAPAAVGHDDVDDRYRFCTEALLSATTGRVDREALQAAVTPLGESLVIAGGDRRVRVHIHSNEPQRFLETVAAFGVIERSKVDDMVLQQISAREATIALVTDSTCDLPERIAFDLGLVTVPLSISVGDESYLDGVDITAEGLLRRLQATALAPTSSQPPVADFRAAYQRLLAYREGIVSVHIAAAQSGTWQAAATAAREVDPERIRVIDSRTNSVGAGLLLEALGEAIAAGASLDELESLANRARADITVIGTVRNLKYAVRGGRVSPRAARIIDALHLKPIIVFDEMGKAGKGGVAPGFRRALGALVSRVERFSGGKPLRLMVVHSGAAEEAAGLAERLQRRFGLADVPVVRAGTVLTAHVGPGSVSVAVRRPPQTH